MLVVALMQLGPASAQLEFALERRRNWSLLVLGQRGQVLERFYSVLERLELALEHWGLPLAQLEQRTVSREWRSVQLEQQSVVVKRERSETMEEALALMLV
jgi:hypothetical protein